MASGPSRSGAYAASGKGSSTEQVRSTVYDGAENEMPSPDQLEWLSWAGQGWTPDASGRVGTVVLCCGADRPRLLIDWKWPPSAGARGRYYCT